LPPSDAVTEEAGEEGAEAPAQGPLRAAPFQWNLLAWAALVGVLSGAAVVGFHVLLGFTNRFLFGGLVEGVMGLVGTLAAKPAPSRFSVQTPKPVRHSKRYCRSASVGSAFCRLHRRLWRSRRSPRLSTG